MSEPTNEQIHGAVRERYAEVAKTAQNSCCGGNAALSLQLGYSPEDLASVPDGANLGLGCGNPQSIAALRAGETVLDLGSGAGFDCFLAAKQVGPRGRVIGVDMTPEMLAKARANATRTGVTNVEFRLGEIEHLPVADASVDVILSNCVVNLAPDKLAVYREAFRVLKVGGRLAISDVVALAPMPASLAKELNSISCCIGGAASVDTTRDLLRAAGFGDVRVNVRTESQRVIAEWAPGQGLEKLLASADIEAVKTTESPAVDDTPAAQACCAPACCSGATR